MDKASEKAARYEKLFKERQKINFTTFTISQWQETFKNIYGGRVHISTLETLGFHFLEEAGEMALAVRNLSQLKNIVAEKIPGIDLALLHELSAVEGIVKNYVEYCGIEIDHNSKDPKMLKARIVDAKMSMVIEIADTFSWFCSVLNKLNSISEENGMSLPSLEDGLNQEYFDKDGNIVCPACKNKNCSCVFFS